MNRRVALVFVALLLAWACEGKPGPGPAGSKAAKARTEAQPAAEAKAQPAAKAVSPAPAAAPASQVERRQDPPWFREDLMADTKLVKKSRSQGAESMMLFALPEGASPEDCVAKVKEKLEPHVSLVEAPGQGKPGQLTYKGETDEYRVTVVCGDAKGTTRAYLGYQWVK
jgi:hypothetical protein